MSSAKKEDADEDIAKYDGRWAWLWEMGVALGGGLKKKTTFYLSPIMIK